MALCARCFCKRSDGTKALFDPKLIIAGCFNEASVGFQQKAPQFIFSFHSRATNWGIHVFISQVQVNFDFVFRFSQSIDLHWQIMRQSVALINWALISLSFSQAAYACVRHRDPDFNWIWLPNVKVHPIRARDASKTTPAPRAHRGWNFDWKKCHRQRNPFSRPTFAWLIQPPGRLVFESAGWLLSRHVGSSSEASLAFRRCEKWRQTAERAPLHPQQLLQLATDVSSVR